MRIDYKETAEFLRNNDNFYIFTHANPDGDAVGSSLGLCAALRKMGKKANVLCSDEFPGRYEYITGFYKPMEFEPQTVVTVDVADIKLLGEKYISYGKRADLCIDHHISNKDFAPKSLVIPEAAAACQVVFYLIRNEKLTELDSYIASCLYTGIITDTGSFKFDCTSPETHMAAAELIGYDIDAAMISRRMFDMKSRPRIAVEQHVLSTLEYYYNDKCSLAVVTLDDMERAGMPESEFEGLAALTVIPETVEVGIIIRQKSENRYKVSMRSTGRANVSEICSQFGGGGHIKAAGCTLEGDIAEIKKKVSEAASEGIKKAYEQS